MQRKGFDIHIRKSGGRDQGESGSTDSTNSTSGGEKNSASRGENVAYQNNKKIMNYNPRGDNYGSPSDERDFDRSASHHARGNVRSPQTWQPQGFVDEGSRTRLNDFSGSPRNKGNNDFNGNDYNPRNNGTGPNEMYRLVKTPSRDVNRLQSPPPPPPPLYRRYDEQSTNVRYPVQNDYMNLSGRGQVDPYLLRSPQDDQQYFSAGNGAVADSTNIKNNTGISSNNMGIISSNYAANDSPVFLPQERSPNQPSFNSSRTYPRRNFQNESGDKFHSSRPDSPVLTNFGNESTINYSTNNGSNMYDRNMDGVQHAQQHHFAKQKFYSDEASRAKQMDAYLVREFPFNGSHTDGQISTSGDSVKTNGTDTTPTYSDTMDLCNSPIDRFVNSSTMNFPYTPYNSTASIINDAPQQLDEPQAGSKAITNEGSNEGESWGQFDLDKAIQNAWAESAREEW